MARVLEKSFAVGELSASRVVSFRERHRLGIPAELDIEVLLPAYADVEDLVGQTAALQVDHEGSPPRSFVGVVEAAAVARSGMACASEPKTVPMTRRIVSV